MCLSLAIAASPALAEDAPPKFVVADYLKGLADLSDRFAHCSGEGILTTTSTSQGETVTHARHHAFALARDAGRLVITNLDRPAEAAKKGMIPVRHHKVVYGYNDLYSFALTRPAPDQGFVVQMREDGPNKGEQKFLSAFNDASAFATRAGVMPIERLISGPTTHVEGVREVEPALGSRRLRVDFTSPVDPTRPKGRPGGIHYIAGWLVVSPELGWILHEYGLVYSFNVDLLNPSTVVGRVDYERSPDGGVRPTKIERRYYPGKHDADPAGLGLGLAPTATETYIYTSFRLGATPAGEFTLPAFGLPEDAEPAANP